VVDWLVPIVCLFWVDTNLIVRNKTAQLKVNLRPLWSPAAAALASLSQRFGDVVWKLLFEEVEKFTCVTSPSSRLEMAESEQNLTDSASNDERTRDKENDEDPWEEERSWRDPSAHNLRSVVIDWDDISLTRRAMQVSFIFYVPF